VGFFFAVTVIWALLRFFDIVETPWLWVFSPTWIPIGLGLLFWTAGEVITALDRRKNAVHRKKAALNAFLDKLHYAIAQHGPDSKEVILLVDKNGQFRNESDKARERARRA
jgi:hypothetical protein